MHTRRSGAKEHKKTGKEVIVNVGPVEKRIALLADGKLADFFMEREGIEQHAGSIYKGKVSSIIPGIEAAFVDIGHKKNAFLHVSDVVDKSSVLKEILPDEDEPVIQVQKKGKQPRIQDILKTGQEIMVQIVKESIGTKGARVTSYISIPGRYLVLTPFDGGFGVSRRIGNREERKRIREILTKIKAPSDVGCIVRTVAENRSEKELKDEFRYLLNLWERVRNREKRQPAPAMIYEEYGIILRMIRDRFTEDISQFIVDSKDEYNRIIKFLKAFMPSLRQKVKLYNGKVPLFQKYDIEKEVDMIFERKIPLKSGGYLVIEQTEGLVAIDVNTGSYTGKKGLEYTAFRTNIEAAEEIPRQLLLRDVGGIIIIDFIDMEEKHHRDKVFEKLQENLRGDKARINVRGISQFGIVEMTRQRQRKSIESTSHIECPYCGGKGSVKSSETIAIETAREVDKVLSKSAKKQKHVTVTMHPHIHAVLVSDQARVLRDIQRKYRCKIDLREDRLLHVEDVIIEEA